MRIEYIYRRFLRTFSIVLLMPFIFTGCIGVGDNLSDCESKAAGVHTIQVKAVPTPGADAVADADVKDITLYIFDRYGKLIATKPATINQIVPLDYPDAGSLHVVAVANYSSLNETITNFSPGQDISSGNITLNQLTAYLSMPTYSSPTDLFWGEAGVINANNSDEHVVLDIMRITATVNIKIRGLKEYVGTTDDNFTVVVNTDYNTVNFEGTPSGTNTNHLTVGGTFSTSGSYSQLEIPTFGIFSSTTGSNITINIYHNDTLIDAFSADYSGNPLTTYNGRLLEVRINYIGALSITVNNAQWGQESFWKDFS